jgi:hypothetical protein
MSLSEATVSVPKKKAVFQTGKKKGKLRPGCRYTTGGRTACSPEAASRLGVTSGSFTVSGRRRKKSASKKSGSMRITNRDKIDLKIDIGPDGTLRVLKTVLKPTVEEKTYTVPTLKQEIKTLRKQFASAKRCKDKVAAINDLRKYATLALERGEELITTAEIEKRLFAANAFCKSKRAAADKARYEADDAADSAALLGLSGTRRRRKARKSGGHPCASPNPPSWCNKKRKSRRKSKR